MFFAILSIFFLFSRHKGKISFFAFLKFSISHLFCFPGLLKQYYQHELHLEKKKIMYFEIKKLLLRTVLYPDGIYLFKVNNGNTRVICEICPKLTIKTPKRRQWRLALNFNTFMKDLYYFRYVICEIRCPIWYHLYILKNVKNIHGGVLLLVLNVILLQGCFHVF